MFLCWIPSTLGQYALVIIRTNIPEDWVTGLGLYECHQLVLLEFKDCIIWFGCIVQYHDDMTNDISWLFFTVVCFHSHTCLDALMESCPGAHLTNNVPISNPVPLSDCHSLFGLAIAANISTLHDSSWHVHIYFRGFYNNLDLREMIFPASWNCERKLCDEYIRNVPLPIGVHIDRSALQFQQQ